MSTLARCAMSVLVLLTLAGCAGQSQQVRTADSKLQTAIKECSKKTWDIMSDENQPARSAYFRICMDEYGYDEKSYKALWIEVLY